MEPSIILFNVNCLLSVVIWTPGDNPESSGYRFGGAWRSLGSAATALALRCSSAPAVAASPGPGGGGDSGAAVSMITVRVLVAVRPFGSVAT